MVEITDTKTVSQFIRTFNKYEEIFHQGTTGDEMYIVYSGKVGLYLEGKNDRELLTVLTEGDFFGEMALVDDSPRSATGIAEADDTQLLALDKKKFIYLLRNQPNFALIVMAKLCWNLRYSNTLKKTAGEVR